MIEQPGAPCYAAYSQDTLYRLSVVLLARSWIRSYYVLSMWLWLLSWSIVMLCRVIHPRSKGALPLAARCAGLPHIARLILSGIVLIISLLAKVYMLKLYTVSIP